ncbi:MAG: Mth938-like domain-containing protein [Ferrovibrio sp.]|uniref:Mth938-like domain-containing protein n=1 Tax=Ferrovibrio sp. TaxID=1917215 RepID=UPI00262C336A|nr:Mth938-like domain-containing protein [Ferrovibrio sp.]MCW0236477.1 Mth938-like domain-containing protein [Ferrovibrio sp.]
MDLLPRIPADRQVINAYGDGGFRITGRHWTESVLVFPGQTLSWGIADIAALTPQSLDAVFTMDPVVELLLIGCGPNMVFIDKAVRAEIRARGLVIEALDTGAACRTYNLLMGEGRRIAAALIPV